MPEMKKDKEMRKEDFQCKFYKSIAYIKFYDNKSVLIVGSDVEETTSISTHCVKIVQIPSYFWSVSGVDLMDQL